jgi:hypothetical protein
MRGVLGACQSDCRAVSLSRSMRRRSGVRSINLRMKSDGRAPRFLKRGRTLGRGLLRLRRGQRAAGNPGSVSVRLASAMAWRRMQAIDLLSAA